MTPLSPIELKKYLDAALEAASLAGAILKHYWGKVQNISHKDASIDLVTEADTASEKGLITYLKKHFPTHAFLAEESGLEQHTQSEYLWVIDPLDGTTNYTHQYPMVAISIALLYRGTPVVGVIYNPILNELFQGALGQGAMLNQQPIHVSSIATLDCSLLASGFPYDRKDNPDNNYAEFCHLTQLSQGVRRGGAASLDLAYVAAGRLDGYWERGIKSWDIAAGILLVTEAGGTVSSYDLSPLDLNSGKVLASNGFIHTQISQEVVGAKRIHSNKIYY